MSSVDRSPPSTAASASSRRAKPADASPRPTRMQAELRQGHQLEVDVAGLAVARSRARRRQASARSRSAIAVGAGDPAPSRAGGPALDRLEQPVGAAEPAVGHRRVGEVGLVGDGQPHRAHWAAAPAPRSAGTPRTRGRSDRPRRGSSPNHHSAMARPNSSAAVSLPVPVRRASNPARASCQRPSARASSGSSSGASPVTPPLLPLAS